MRPATPHDDDTARSHPGSRAAHNGASTLSDAQRVHELRSLLDGSLRCLRLVRAALDTESDNRRIGNGAPAVDSAGGDSALAEPTVLGRLTTAEHAMQRMVELLGLPGATSDDERASTVEPGEPDEPRTLSTVVDRVALLLMPMANESGVALSIDVAPACAELPAHALDIVLHNVMRNAVEACCRVDGAARCVELAVRLVHDQTLSISVADTGPGFPMHVMTGRGPRAPGTPAASRSANGRGFGLAICRQIVDDLCGTIQITNVPFQRGAVVHITIPKRKLLPA